MSINNLYFTYFHSIRCTNGLTLDEVEVHIVLITQGRLQVVNLYQFRETYQI